MWLYAIPFVVFLLVGVLINLYTPEEKKNNIKAIVPAFIVSVLVFVLIKYTQQTHEPMMPGNYFDTV